MSDEENADDGEVKSPREKASKIPSWIMVGFVLGALSFYTVSDYFGSREKTPPPAPADPESATVPAPSPSPQPAPAPQPPDTSSKNSPLIDNSRQMTLFAIDAIFRQWEVNAMWEYGTTQVVFWNPADEKYSTAVEVFRLGTEDTGYEYYYRRILSLTRPPIRDDSRPDAPIIFTESEEATKRRVEKQNERWRR